MTDRQIREVLKAMGFKVYSKNGVTTVSKGTFAYSCKGTLGEMRLDLLLIYYGDQRVMNSVGSSSNGWK
jgi:hypothetical protein